MKFTLRFATIVLIGLACIGEAVARDINYSEGEIVVYLIPNKPTKVTFPSKIISGNTWGEGRKFFILDRRGNSLVLNIHPQFPKEGANAIIHLDDKRTYTIRAILADDRHIGDRFVNIIDKQRN
jgi:hypothetical protein